ncbi:MAG: ribosomal protein S19 family protein [Candidatus Moeniiplasma glomeromycotorum]|nr:ribosomal protein S19 family protein [Candidatus Moeniiplasma glomeromycotorum]MCE8168322.1 ribosomal protein S19 family protein [Candidatus Moeniiplasma glomeromycotorum]MCE8169880.1 ribosomal protein S19 family protein [Candidatus Moeniiplasma glomeromycotorum]
MSRSLKKPLYIDEKLKKKIEKRQKEIAELEKKKGKEEEIAKILFTPIKVWCRNSIIFPEMIGYSLLIHNGKKFFKRQITQDMVGHKIGEFAPTRQVGQHGKAGTH